MIGAILGLWLQVQTGAPFGVQLGVTVRPETVTVGQHFVATVIVRAPGGATIRFPVSPRTPNIVDTAGHPVRLDTTTATYTQAAVAYVLAAWDTGAHPINLGDVTIETPSGERTVTVNDAVIRVRSVLPADTTKRIPKPPRPPIAVKVLNWWPWIMAALIAAALGLAWAVWRWWRRRSEVPIPPIAWAEREFLEIEAMRLLERGEPEQHAMRMVGVLRRYLDRRVPGVHAAATTRELATRFTTTPDVPADRVLRLFEAIDLLKFAHVAMSASDAGRMGQESRALVQAIETNIAARMASRSVVEQTAATASQKAA